MSKAIVKGKQVRVRRDANTQSERPVADYELPLLYASFGKENVVVLSDATKTIELDAEVERMSMRYGHGKVLRVYGDDGGERLREKIDAAVIERLPDEAVATDEGAGEGEQPASQVVHTRAAEGKPAAAAKKAAPAKTAAKTAPAKKGATPMTADQILAGANA